jgi:hypothetical protein
MEIRIPYIFDEKDCIWKVEREFQKILIDSNMSINYIENYIEKYKTLYEKEHQNELNRFSQNFEKLEKNLSELKQPFDRLNDLNNNLKDLSAHWNEKTKPINSYGVKLDILLLSLKNVSTVKENLFLFVHNKVKELDVLIDHEFEESVIEIYKQIKMFETLRTSITNNNIKTTDFFYISDINKLVDKFYNKFWGYFDDIIGMSKHNPEFLVKLIRIIDEDDSYSDDVRASIGSEIRFKCEDSDRSHELRDQLMFKLRVNALKQAEEMFELGVDINGILDTTTKIAICLYNVQDIIIKLFPPEYKIFALYEHIYLQIICDKIIPIMRDDNLQSNFSEFARWLDKMENILHKMNLSLEQTQLKDVKYNLIYSI